MDPFSAEGELVNIHSAFHQGQYQNVVHFDTEPFSRSNTLAAKTLQYRAAIALGKSSKVLVDLKGDKDASTPDLRAVKLLAQYQSSQDAKVIEEAEKLASADGDNLGVQLCCGTILAASGNSEGALALLAKHQGSLDAVALIIQIYLQQNRVDLAAKEARQARNWAQDSLLVNLAESWVGMREGGEKYQQAYYVFEELAQAQATTSVRSITAQAVAELHLGRLPEAEAALAQAAGIHSQDPEVLANSITLNTLLNKDVTDLQENLQKISPQHPLVVDLAAKKEAFDAACSKYAPKVQAS